MPLSVVVRDGATVQRVTPAPRDISAAAQALVDGYRVQGYRHAAINPLAPDNEAALIAELDPATYGLSLDDADDHPIRLDSVADTMTLAQLLAFVRQCYCGSVSLQSAHVRSAEQRQWLYARMESRFGPTNVTDLHSLHILSTLAAAEAFEQFHRANYPRSKHFSLEGSESLVVLLRTVVESAAEHGVEDLVMGMPHRGRLNMMLNALDVPATHLMSLFSAHPEPSLARSDLKDHAGLSARIHTAKGDIRILLAHNPSHLEAVSPVVCGMARALQDHKHDGAARNVMPVLIHGDASFSGQGIVTETLNLSQTRGYGVGGTLHLILNNQIGSTISHPGDSRSTLYGSDIARAIDAPILHVNADDPDAAVFAAQTATEYRLKFGADIVIDHVGYRRFGHFGGDDPTMTRPAMQRHILAHPSVVDLYANRLRAKGLVRDDDLARLKSETASSMAASVRANEAAVLTAAPQDHRTRVSRAKVVISTAVPIARLRALLKRLGTVPDGFALHPTLAKMAADWRSSADEDDRSLDWCLAENLAYASLVANGFNVRLSGLDVGRGSFFHRHHVWHEQTANVDWQTLHIPLRNVAEGQGSFAIFESPLSEEAVLGFEYGYTLKCGRDLVIWEAQFGDFVNNAQVIIDQFIASGESKWGYRSGLVILLPHGHDGGGPEHSSAYLGRFLQLCAEDNMQVAMPTTAAQLYHVLRRQALTDDRKPLVVMTPKFWMHTHAPSFSRLHDLAEGEFHPLIEDGVAGNAATVFRAIVASGKVYYDLLLARTQACRDDLPILRVEQLHPFPTAALRRALAAFPLLRQVVWAQEEAKNHGAWYQVRDELEAALPAGVTLVYAGRPPAAASAVCDAAQHAAEKQMLVSEALGLRRPI